MPGSLGAGVSVPMRQSHRSPSWKYQTDPVKPRASASHAAGMHALVYALAGKASQFTGVYRNDKLARTLIHAVLAANLGFIFLHICLRFIVYFDFQEDRLFRRDLLISTEGGYPEMFNYLQLAVLGWLMFHVFVRTRQAIYAALGIFFLFALGEDALQLHERIGSYTARLDLPAPSSLGAQHFGEVLYWMVVGALSLVVLIYGLIASNAEDRKIGAIFFLLAILLGSFAAVVDAAHVVLEGAFFGAGFLLETIEDGGEMLVAALALSTALLLFRHLDDLRRPSRRAVGSQ